MSKDIPKPRPLVGNAKVELDLSYYLTKADLENTTRVDTLKFSNNVDLASSKSETEKLDIGKLGTILFDLSNLSDVVKNEVVKKMYVMNWLRNLMLFRLLILVIQLKKLTKTQNF